MSLPGILVGPDPDPCDARHRLARATRQIIGELASSAASSDEFERARDLVEQAAALLHARSHDRGYEVAEASLIEHMTGGTFLDASPFVGRLNPLAPPIEVTYEPDHPLGPTIVGLGTFGAAYEGPPGCVHGGFIAGAFDEVLGVTQSMSGQPGMTAHLEIDYRSPTPLHHEVRFEGRIERIEGRKIHAVATLHHGDRLCAEARGLFVSMRPEVFDRLMAARRQAEG